MLGIATNYLRHHGGRVVDAAYEFTLDLMRGDEDSLKSGYTLENALLSAFEAFDLNDLDKIRLVLHCCDEA